MSELLYSVIYFYLHSVGLHVCENFSRYYVFSRDVYICSVMFNIYRIDHQYNYITIIE